MFSKQQSPGSQVPQRLRLADFPAPFQACCCPAWPAVKVIMPPTATRDHPVDLWLCRHHYRASEAALLEAGATVLVLSGAQARPAVTHVAPVA